MKRDPRLGGFRDWFKSRKAEAPRHPAPSIPVNVDLYAALELEPSVSTEEIREQYRRIAKLIHPDRNPSKEAAEVFQAATEAYTVLADPDRRAAYDKARAAAAPQRRAPAPEGEAVRPPAGAAPRPQRPERPSGTAMWEYMFGPAATHEKDIFTSFKPGAQREERGSLRTYFEASRPRPEPARPPSSERLAEWIRSNWGVDPMWTAARQARQDPRFREAGGVVSIVQLAGPRSQEQSLAEALGVPKEIVERHESQGQISGAFWGEVLNPLINAFPQAMRRVQPDDLPGTFYIHPSPDNSGIDLYYSERVR